MIYKVLAPSQVVQDFLHPPYDSMSALLVHHPRYCSNAPVPFAETTLASCDKTGSAEKPGLAILLRFG